MPGSTWITAITSKGMVWSDHGDTSAVISAGGRAPVPTLQTLTPRAWLVLPSPHHPVSQLEGCSQTPFPCSLFAGFPLLFKPKAHQGFLCELCTGRESGSARRGLGKYGRVAGAACSPEPRQVPLKLLLLSLEVLDVFHLGTQSHPRGGEGRQHQEWAGRYIPIDLAGHPTTPRWIQGLHSPQNGPAEGFQGFFSQDSAAGYLPSPCIPAALGKGTAGLCALDFSWTTQSAPPKLSQALASPGGQTSAPSISQSLSLCHWPRTPSRACALTLALNTDPPKGKATIQVRQEEMDQRTDPTSLHPTDPGNQDRKSQGSLTGLTRLNEHLASPMESWIKPSPGRA